MARTLTLKFVDGCSKTCEVTGREMGGDKVYYKALSLLKPGAMVDWGTDRKPDHKVLVKQLGKDFVVAEVYNLRGTLVGGPYKVYMGVPQGHNYMFGEWSYKFSLTLVWD